MDDNTAAIVMILSLALIWGLPDIIRAWKGEK